MTIKPDGVNELDPCLYELVEKWQNVTIEVLRCQRCGHTEIIWRKQDDSVDVTDMEDR